MGGLSASILWKWWHNWLFDVQYTVLKFHLLRNVVICVWKWNDVCDKGFKKTIYMHVTANRDKDLDLSGD